MAAVVVFVVIVVANASNSNGNENINNVGGKRGGLVSNPGMSSRFGGGWMTYGRY